jgi:predicted dehydrogenase
MVMGLTIGVCGAGSFARSFIPLFAAHPLVDQVYLAEALPERRAEQAARFGIRRTFASLEELCASDCDAVALFTQRWLHGPQALAALEAGKHVYSAVPAAVTVAEMAALVAAVERTGLTYMVGETSYYYPATLYCRERFRRGDFGRFVYGEGEYLHDMTHGFYDAYRHSGGDEWKRTASFPPMLYPTHSVSMILSVTGARLTHVSCLGQVDAEADGVFKADVSLWGNEFSNETALFRSSDGGMVRINEFRRVGVSGGASVRLSLYGTRASFEEQTNARVWNTLATDDPANLTDLTDRLACKPLPIPAAARGEVHAALQADFFMGVAAVHPVERLPATFAGLPNGHYGSHQFLVCDFVEAIVNRTLPPNNVWESARNCLPGIIAHESAQRGGELLAIPDLGDPPGG